MTRTLLFLAPRHLWIVFALTLGFSPAHALAHDGFPPKPQDLDEVSWTTLREAVESAAVQQAELTVTDDARMGADGAENNGFGYAIALDGNTALVGVNRGSLAASRAPGSAYVLVRRGTRWVLQAVLNPGRDDNAEDQDDGFAVAVALSGDTALVGAPLADDYHGVAYVFARADGQWSLQARLIGDEPERSGRFGASVALSGDTALIGASEDDIGASSQQGSAHVFVRRGTQWNREAKLVSAIGEEFDHFGHAVALDGDTAVVSISMQEFREGSAIVFTRQGSQWTEQATLTANDAIDGSEFGRALALSGDSVAVGAPGVESVYVFSRRGSDWSQQTKLTSDRDTQSRNFGAAIALRHDALLVGAPGSQDDVHGMAFVFVREGDRWSLESTLPAMDERNRDEFGSAVALAESTALVGNWREAIGASQAQGAVRVFVRGKGGWAATDGHLTVGDGSERGDALGYSVALSGDTALVGTWSDDINSHEDQGSVRVFVRHGNGWSQQTRLFSRSGRDHDQFGYSVALSGDVAVVGAPGTASKGAAYVFQRNGDEWFQRAELTAPEGAEWDFFGAAVTVSDDTILVGAPNATVDAHYRQGSAYVFVHADTEWMHQASLVTAYGAANSSFGTSLALSGDTALIGAPHAPSDYYDSSGAASIFVRQGNDWNEQVHLRLAGLDGYLSDDFGLSVAISDRVAVVGAPGKNEDRGAVYLFAREGSSWVESAKLQAPDGDRGDQFGHSVAIAKASILIGTPGDSIGTEGSQGSAYLFWQLDGHWLQQAKLVAERGAEGDVFGSAIAMSDDRYLLGAPGAGPAANHGQGAAYVFAHNEAAPTSQSMTWQRPQFIFKHEGTRMIQSAPLTVDSDVSNPDFGMTVALSGDHALLGVPDSDDHQGSAHIYAKRDGGWVEEAALVGDTHRTRDQFGHTLWYEFGRSVALSSDTALVGAKETVEVFVKSGSSWIRRQHLVPKSQLSPLTDFGSVVALSGDTALVGYELVYVGSRDSKNLYQNIVYVFVRRDGTWTQQATLTSTPTFHGVGFGRVLALSGDTALIGAPMDRIGSNQDQGSAYVFVRRGETWTLQAKLTASDGREGAAFGVTVALEGDNAAVAALSYNTAGSVYVFQRNGDAWKQQAKFEGSTNGQLEGFGSDVVLSGAVCLVSSSGALGGQGLVYVFERVDDVWQQRMIMSRGDSASQFGVSLAASGDEFFIGTTGAYIYKTSPTSNKADDRSSAVSKDGSQP